MQTPTGIREDGPRSRSRSRSVGRSLAATGMFLSKQFWAWPMIAAAILAGLGFWLRVTVEGVMKLQMADDLQTILNANVDSLRQAARAHEAFAWIASEDPEVRSLAREIVATPGRSAAELIRSPSLPLLRTSLKPWQERYEYDGFVLFDADGRILAAGRDALIAKSYPAEVTDFLTAAFAGRAIISRPFPSVAMLPDLDGKERVGVPTMLAVAPILGDQGKVVAALGLRMNPERTFGRILGTARRGSSGETYAFDRAGRLLSASRFDDDLKRLGLIADQPHVRAILNLELRDPGVDMMAGGRPARRRHGQPLNRMVAEAVQGRSGVDVDGHRDYRGVTSIGAWTWLPEYGIGIATEVDKAEAYRSLAILRVAFWSLFGLLAAAAAAIFASTVLMARLRLKIRKAALTAQQLGRYTLDEKIGEGGMGAVYRAHHAMLHRSTAIKLLSPEKTTEVAIARFEREVQLTSRLNHPNTITIFDYGRTPEGIFYYAMELLDGLDLQTLVDRDGPQPEGRVIHILSQVCGSLAEAHDIGLVHRDIKPANILLNRRGGLPDFVKVVDFGLVKAIDQHHGAGLTATNSIIGTPLYLPPEAIQDAESMDARGDLYAIGAVGYFLLTGRPVFEGGSISELLFKQVTQPPASPSARLGRPVSGDLEATLLRCLAKSPKKRFATARELGAALNACRTPGTWTIDEAEAWWQAETTGRGLDSWQQDNRYQTTQMLAAGPAARVADDTIRTVALATVVCHQHVGDGQAAAQPVQAESDRAEHRGDGDRLDAVGHAPDFRDQAGGGGLGNDRDRLGHDDDRGL